MCDTIQLSSDDDILHLCAKIKIATSSFMFEAGRIKKAINFSLKAVIIITQEIKLRLKKFE